MTERAQSHRAEHRNQEPAPENDAAASEARVPAGDHQSHARLSDQEQSVMDLADMAEVAGHHQTAAFWRKQAAPPKDVGERIERALDEPIRLKHIFETAAILLGTALVYSVIAKYAIDLPGGLFGRKGPKTDNSLEGTNSSSGDNVVPIRGRRAAA